MPKHSPSSAHVLSGAQLDHYVEQLNRIAALPITEQTDEAWSELAAMATEAGDYALMQRCILARHALKLANPDRETYRAWDQALLALQLGQVAKQAKDQTAVQQAVREAIAALTVRESSQVIDFKDWLRLGDDFIDLDPTCFQAIAQQVLGEIKHAVLLVQRDALVRLARLEAKALYAQGQLAAALAKSVEGRFDLVDDYDDAFSAQVLLWLMEAQRYPEAAKLAFESAFAEREYSSQLACHLAFAETQTAQVDIYWPLTLAAAALLGKPAGICEAEACQGMFLHYLQQAKQLQDKHPAVLILEAQYILHTLNDVPRALPLFEQAVPQFEWLNAVVLADLWRARLSVHGAKRALNFPFLKPQAGSWSCSFALELDDLSKEFPQDNSASATDFAALALRYYELGLQQFEAFFNSGQGNYKSADIDAYALICEKLFSEQPVQTKAVSLASTSPKLGEYFH